MKTFAVLIVLLCLCTSFAVSQKIEAKSVPAAAKAALVQQFPEATKIQWEMEQSEYEVNFVVGKVRWSANFDSAGTLLETEEAVPSKSLPTTVAEALKKQFPGFRIEEANKLSTPGSPMMYEVELEKNEQSVEVRLSADGNIISKKTEEEHEKGEKD